MQYSPERLHAPRAVPLIDLDDFDQRHQQYSREAAAAYMARAPSALSMGYGVPMPAGYFYQQYYQPPMYNEFVNVPDFMQYYQPEEGPLAARDGEGAKDGGLHGGGSPTPSSMLMHGLNLREEDPANKSQQSTMQQQHPQQEQQPPRNDRQRKRRSASQPRPASTAPNNDGDLPAYEDYREAIGEDRPQQRQQSSQETRTQPHRDGGIRKDAEQVLPHTISRRSQAQDTLAKKEPLTRANVHAAGIPPHGDLYDTYMWFLEARVHVIALCFPTIQILIRICL
jgi:hypothetical protein